MFLALSFFAPACAARAEVARAGRVVDGTFHSESLGADVRYAVSLPPSYDADTSRRYPLVIFLHGLFNDEHDWVERGMQARVDELRASGKVGDFIVAAPYGANSFYLNGKDGTRYEDAIVKDFLPFVDKTYRTTGSPRDRVIEGISMGGFGALVIAFKHPELFAAVAAHSAAIFDELPRPPASGDQRATFRYQMAAKIFGDPPDEQFFAANNPIGLAAVNAAKLGALKIYFDVGEQDRYGFTDGNRRLDAALTKAGVAHEFHAVPGDHGWSFLLARSEPAMAFVWSVLGER
jgi:enterochelin esterase-like enzyme